MLQRRIGMIWTRSGCDVCTSPRTNSRTERAFRLMMDGNATILASRDALGRAEALDALADLERAVEDRSDRDEPEELMPRDGREARRRDAAALRAVGRAAELARRDARGEVGGDRLGRLREDAVVRRLRRLRVDFDEPLRQRELRVPHPQRQQILDDRDAIGRTEPLRGHLADLRRVEADPDFLDLGPRRPELEELLDVSLPAD